MLKRINVNPETHIKCPIDDTFPKCIICNKEMKVSVNVDIHQTRRFRLIKADICADCAKTLVEGINSSLKGVGKLEKFE